MASRIIRYGCYFIIDGHGWRWCCLKCRRNCASKYLTVIIAIKKRRKKRKRREKKGRSI